jgi:hypothetical protein
MLVSRSRLCDATRGKLVIDMKKHRRSARPARRSRRAQAAASTPELPGAYQNARRLAVEGRDDEARLLYAELHATPCDARLQALITNDLATLDAVNGDFDAARRGLEEALAIDESCRPARLNLELLVNRLGLSRENACDAEAGAARTEPRPPTFTGAESGATEAESGAARAEPRPPTTTGAETGATEAEAGPARTEPRPPAIAEKHVDSNGGVKAEAGLLNVVGRDWEEPTDGVVRKTNGTDASQAERSTPIRIAILSFLFNWPSTGGGNIHTVELATFLGRAGYQVRHIYVRYPEWGIGRVGDVLPFESQAMEFDRSSWGLDEIRARYRRAVRSFDPDYVIITDAWNMKPILAEAVEGFPYYLRFQALECLCPLNNLRLLAISPRTVEQCPRNQLANPDVRRRCLAERGHHSGSLHQWERDLCRVGTPEYDRQLRRALEEAEAALVLNPLIAALVEPFARNVRVAPWGMAPSRFPWPPGDGLRDGRPSVELGGGVRTPAPSAEPTPSERCGHASRASVPGLTRWSSSIRGQPTRRRKSSRSWADGCSIFPGVTTFQPHAMNRCGTRGVTGSSGWIRTTLSPRSAGGSFAPWSTPRSIRVCWGTSCRFIVPAAERMATPRPT